MFDDCPLCKREVITRVLYKNEKWWITECKTCRVPMIVLKEHRAQVTTEEMAEAKRILEWAVVLYGYKPKKMYFDCRMKRIKDHWHGHLRCK